MKRLFSIFLVIAMLVTTCAVSVSAATYTDIDGHWAKNEIEAWSDYGVISGYDGQFSPNRFITRGEFAVVLSRLMGYQKESENVFGDLADKFYTSYVLKLYKAGVMQGYDGLIRPEASLTREEASVMICRALGINAADSMNRTFSDEADVSSWSKGYINAMVNSGLLNGTDGKLNPQNPISRAEVVKILDNAVYPILKAGTFSNVDTGKIVLICAGNVIIKDSEIAGTVIITQGVTNENIAFTNSKLESNIVIDNDRSAFIKVENTTVANSGILNHKAFITGSLSGSSGLSGGGSGSSGGGGSAGGGGGGGGSDITTYNVTFKVNNRVIRTSRIASGSKIGNQLPADPTVEGYIFRGWKDASTGNPVTADTIVRKTMTVVADLEVDSTTGGSTTGGSTTGGSTTGGSTTGGSTTGGTTTGGSETENPCETGHTYGDWQKEDDDNHKKVCILCGDMVAEAHDWDNGVITQEPTTTEEGIKTYTCPVCNGTKEEAIEKLPDPETSTTITVGDVIAESGDEITVPVSILDNVGLTGLEISVGYDSEALTLTGSEKGEALGGLTFTMSGDVSLNPITFLWDGTDADATNGNILLLKFKVADAANAGEHVIDLTVNSACDADVNDVFVHTVDGKLCVLGNIKITFYEGYGRFAPVIDEVNLNLDSYGQATVPKEDIPSESFPWSGYEKNEYMPDSYADYNGKHEVEPDFWYLNNGQWERFDETVVLRKDTNVYWMYKELSVNAFGTAVTVRYDENSRAMDSMKSFFDKAIPQLETAKEAGLPIYEELSSTLLGAFKNIDWIDDDDGDIKRIDISLDYLDALVETDVERIRDIINSQGTFKITPDTLELWQDIIAELENVTFDDILALESNSEINIMISLLGYDFCENKFNIVKDEYCDNVFERTSLVEDGVEAEAYYPLCFTMIFNPVSEILRPLFDEAEERVISEFDESIRYNENPYLQYLIEDIDIIDELFERVDIAERNHSGYRLKDLISYAEFMTKMFIAVDDALCWYGDISDSEFEIVADAILAETKAVYNKFKAVLNDPECSDKISAEFKAAFECIKQAKDMISGISPTLKENIGDHINLETEAVLNELINNGNLNFRELIDSGELYTRIEEFKNSSMGQYVDPELVDGFVDVAENIAEYGLEYYRVQSTDETIIDKYEIEIGNQTFSMSRYFVF